jgi:multisubunit Na+/H+ antiporter MnhG subunit
MTRALVRAALFILLAAPLVAYATGRAGATTHTPTKAAR